VRNASLLEPIIKPTRGALGMLLSSFATDPANDLARFDYVKQLLLAGREDDAKVAFALVVAQASVSQRLDGLERWMDAIDFSAIGADGAVVLG
jgi:putative thioredoxin